MTNLNKVQLISYETAKLAKEADYDVPTPYYYDDTRSYMNPYYPSLHTIYEGEWHENDYYGVGNSYSAPLQSLMQKWLREKCGIHINVIPDYSIVSIGRFNRYIHKSHDEFCDALSREIKTGRKRFDTYEEALEDAIKEGLGRVIESQVK